MKIFFGIINKLIIICFFKFIGNLLASVYREMSLFSVESLYWCSHYARRQDDCQVQLIIYVRLFILCWLG